MKELSIEQKAKRYDEALEIARQYWNDRVMPIGTNFKLERMFPELKESDDERIRKWLIELVEEVRKANPNNVEHNGMCSEALDWLEKQSKHANFRNKIQIGDKVTRNMDGVLVNLSQLNRVAKKDEKQGEQKPAWSEEDEKRTKDIIYFLDTAKQDYTSTFVLNAWIDWLKSLKDKVQPKQEWSKDDETFLNTIVSDLDYSKSIHNKAKCNFINNEINWLKSLKDRVQSKQEWSEEDCNQIETIACHLDNIGNGAMAESLLNIMDKYKSLRLQNTWKPSDEQMAVLNEVINYAANSELQHWSSFIYTLLKSLREQLKKLREE